MGTLVELSIPSFLAHVKDMALGSLCYLCYSYLTYPPLLEVLLYSCTPVLLEGIV